MFEAPQGPDPKRLLLAVVITSAVLMVYSYFFHLRPNLSHRRRNSKTPNISHETPPEIKPPSQIL